jgi:nucleoside-diphosphate-sugar epimerase/quercetin dioxygenase-like cupin family protein
MKIVITGGLGYIGTEICKIYSGESRYKDITVIDSRFISERVKQLRDWGISFKQCSLFDEDILKELLKDADIIIHLAGITDVAYTKTESNTEKDLEITKVGVDGTRNVLRFCPSNCKIIFPSTHVVYEGFDSTRLDIDESVPPCPVLTYAKGKVQSEKDIVESGKNYVILRLASVYGYSTDTMRIGIMPNLFSKIASQNGTIKLFSGGVQLKSLVPLIDVARCFKFMAESSVKNEIFHLSKENLTVKDVALICKDINPKLEIIETDDEIPNLGYTISNKKLLETGFTFRYNLKDCIKEMIENWSEKNINEDLEYVIRGTKDFVDERGRISNYELTEPINLIGYIESKAGSVRANHYHPIQEQKCLLIKGKYISVIKDLSDPKSVIETRIIKEGDVAVIKPNVAHAMVFLEDSIFLNLVRGEREHENFGITHTIPSVIVDEDFRVKLLNGYKETCRVCGEKNLNKVISLGKSPLANNLLNNSSEMSETYPLELDYCSSCHNCQLNYVVPPSKMFDDYLYKSSTAASFRNHFEVAAEDYIKRFNLNEKSTVLDIGSNDGIFLKPIKDKGINVIGIEPAKNISEIANSNGIHTINSYFDESVVRLLGTNKIDLITASNVFAHSDDLEGIALRSFEILKEGGALIIEVQYILDTIRDLTFDNIYHEHTNYWSVISLKKFFERLGLKIIDVEHIETHGGSIRVFIKRSGQETENVKTFIENEINFGLKEYKTYKDFSKRIIETKNNVVKNFDMLKSVKGYRLVGYGSPAKATTALNYYGIDRNYLDYTIEDNDLKIDKIIPGVNIPIKNKEYCLKNLPDCIIVLAWNFFDEIKKNNSDLISKGVRFISIKDLQNPDFL